MGFAKLGNIMLFMFVVFVVVVGCSMAYCIIMIQYNTILCVLILRAKGI